MKRRHFLSWSIITIFVIFNVISFSSSLTPYVTFSQAKAASGSVQVRGVLALEPIIPIRAGQGIQFVLRDEAGEQVQVRYSGVKPDGLEQATSIVAIGKYGNEQFVAEKLLIKCPSKYQGSVKKEW